MTHKTVIVYTCCHTDPDVSNERFSWLGELIYDVRPDYTVDLGDFYDMRSLNSFDGRNPEQVVSQNYEKDILKGEDAQERIRHRIKKNKVRRPAYFGFEGNHEYRIKKAISLDPRLKGDKHGLSFNHLKTDYWYDEYHEYKNNGPTSHVYDGILYAHYVSSGNFGSAMSGDYHAHNLLKKTLKSTTVGHSHRRNIYFRDDAKAIGLVAGCYKGAEESWAGQSNKEWWKGVVIKRSLDNGYYEPQFISYNELKEAYS